MYLELQLSADAFERMVRTRLKALSLCVDRQFPDPQRPGDWLVVDQVVIGDDTRIQREKTIELNGAPVEKDAATQHVWIFSHTNLYDVTVPFVQVKQAVSIQLARASELDANGPDPSNAAQVLTIFPVFNVTLTGASNQGIPNSQLAFSYELSYVDFGLLAAALSEEHRATIRDIIAAVGLAPVKVDFSGLSKLLKRPVPAINAGFACDPGANFVALRVDFDVDVSSAAVNRQFFEQGPESFLDGKEWAMLIDATLLIQTATSTAQNALASQDRIRVNEGPAASWDPAGPAIDIGASVEVIDACPFFVDNIDIDVALAIRADYSCPAPNRLHTHFHVGYGPSNVVEELACSATNALLWPFIGPVFLKDEKVGTGLAAYFGGLAVEPAVAFAAILLGIQGKKMDADLSTQFGDSCVERDGDYECDDRFSVGLPMASSGNASLQLERVSGVTRGIVYAGTIVGVSEPVRHTLEPLGVRPFSWQIVGRCRGNGKNNFAVGNRATIGVFGPPPLALCTAYVISDPENEFEVQMDGNNITLIPRFRPSYRANPYPCRLRVVTNRGVRTVTLAPPAEMNDEMGKELEVARLRAVASCYYWEKDFSAAEKLSWIPDPQFNKEKLIQFWQIVVRGLQRNETIEVRAGDGATMMTSSASAAGVAHMTLALDRRQAQPELFLKLGGVGGVAEAGDVPRELSVQQILYEHTATLAIRSGVRVLRFSGSARRPTLLIMDADNRYLWDVSVPLSPVLIETGAIPAPVSCERPAVQGGESIGMPASAGLDKALSKLRNLGPVEAVGAPRVGALAETLYVRTPELALLFDISNPDQPVEIQRYAGNGWCEGIALGGRLLAKYNDEEQGVELYYASKSVLK